jgi:NAD(P)-dependent dehydrogenase (short-subunit alcohol dehydrogenase family)
LAELTEKVAIITGGASGIGRATAEMFVQEGARVIIADISDDLGRQLAYRLGDGAAFIRTDVSRAEEVDRLVTRTVETFGKLDILFNNAGISGNLQKTDLVDEEFEDFEKVLAIDLLGPMLGTKFAARHMRKQAHGSIINTASTAGFYAGFGIPAYRAAKAGVIAFTQMAAVELGSAGIRVNSISPGPVETPIMVGGQYSPELARELMQAASTILTEMQLLKRVGKPKDIANAAVFLASDRSANITGHNIVVDGGSSIGDKVDRTATMQRAFAQILARHGKLERASS